MNRWRANYADGNICLRLAEVPRERLSSDLPFAYAGNNVDGWELIGIDVDDYGDKHGAQQLTALELELGKLPATVVSSARWDDAPLSGTRIFLVPRGFRFHGKASATGHTGPKHIDILYAGLRYLVVWPSMHPTGTVYEFRWGRPGEPLKTYDGIPPLEHVAVLPEPWFRHLENGANNGVDAKSDMNFGELQEWAEATFRDCGGEPCTDMANKLAQYKAELDLSDSHHPMNDVVWSLTKNALEGHAGWHTALNDYLTYWRDLSLSKRDEATLNAEAMRSVDGALAKAKAQHDERNGYMADDKCVGGAGDIDAFAKMVDAVPEPDDDVPSWAPLDIGSARRGIGASPPTILTRSDGACLFYRGKTHSVHGESESGKSWLVQCATAECLLGGEPVLYVDFEDEGGAVAERLILLGVPPEVVDNPTMFAYVHPDVAPTTARERAAFDALLGGTYSLAVVDGVTDAMGVFGLSTKDNDDIAQWHRALPKAIASKTGAAVACVDHVTKDSQTRGRFALGGQHKMAGLSGAAYVVEMEQPFAVGQAGRASVRVGKDRPGLVRGLGGRWRKTDRTQHVADLHLDSTNAERTTWTLVMPENAGKSTDTDKAKPGASKATFRPTWFMEQVSRYWEEADNPAERSNNKTIAAMCAERKEQGKKQHREHWRNAIKLLIGEGYAKAEEGLRGSDIYVVVKPYRQLEDPLCDSYSEADSVDVTNWKRKLSDLKETDET
ncbi:hypothetical protein A5678_04445 [Mycobacterium sp. E2733]|nr:hypothetical protein A5678_04445 [Mycobacterium sp. E2733]